MDADNVLAVLFDEKRASDKGYLYVPEADSDGLDITAASARRTPISKSSRCPRRLYPMNT